LFQFFTVPIRNANTRAAYYRAIEQFMTWVERAGYQHLEDIEPITVAAYIETLQRQAAPPTVKQHMAAIRMLFSWLGQPVSPIFLKMTAPLKPLSESPATPTAGPRNCMTAAARKFARGHGKDSILKARHCS
jgi:hypothetical protein